ncbi:ZIP-like iron-zinc transporter [Mycena metata]|uniref:ZIP-like iron-zinc transporter n=1 Tax=Mycena metata TaxID=1033252 RepID=A0AAD7N2F0_9AGAR|nr:ZIP-like iron-zinc transporter [Mycena metata]
MSSLADECTSPRNPNTYFHLRVASVFIVLVCATGGTLFPVLARRSKWLHVPKAVFDFAKYFGSGVIIATAFIHLLYPGLQELSSPCLAPGWSEYPYALALCLLSIFSIFILELVAFRWGTARLQRIGMRHDPHGHYTGSHAAHGPEGGARTPPAHGASSPALPMPTKETAESSSAASSASASASEDEGQHHDEHAHQHQHHSHDAGHSHSHAGHSHQPGHAHGLDGHGHGHDVGHGHSHQPDSGDGDLESGMGVGTATGLDDGAAAQIVGIAILEFGVLLHSVLIGLTLAVDEGFKVLFVVIVFHQTFEGLGLGSRLAYIRLPPTPRYRHVPVLAALIYGLSTPTGIALGLALRSSYNPGGATASLVSGVLDSLSAGILIYTGLVELLAHEFLFNKEMMSSSNGRLAYAIGTMLLGCAVMALLGKWA